MLRRLLSRKPKAAKPEESKPLTYEQARDILATKDAEARRALAQHPDARPEMLYYLASDDSPEVRLSVVRNPNTPQPACKILANDNNDEVRCELARKISTLLPGLDETEQVKLREQAIEVLESLASDQLPRVRQIVAEELKSADNIPRHVVMQLAHDVELAVCAPILEYSPLLNADDLREIIATTRVQGALTAIARRTNLDADVSADIAATLDIPAVAALLANESAQIREETLDAIIDNAASIEQWHEPIVLRPNLSIRAMRRISTFVASSLIDRMVESRGLPDDIVRDLRERVVERIRSDEFAPVEDEDVQWQAKRIFDRGEITDTYVTSLLHKRRKGLVIELLSLRAGLPREIVRKIIEIGRPEAVTALAWKAGLNMRTAMFMQTDLASVPPARRLNAKGGVDFPLSEEDMEWQLDIYTKGMV